MKTLKTLRGLSRIIAFAMPAALFACGSDGLSGNGVPGADGVVGPTSTGPNGSSPSQGAGAGNGKPVDLANDPSLSEPLGQESAGPLVLRRLSPREYSNTLRDLVGDTSDPGANLPDEGNRQTGFAVYESASLQSVEAFLETAERLLADGRVEVPPCADGGEEQACAAQFINDFGRRAFRRPVKNSESTNLLALFDTARGLGFEYSEAVGHLATAMLQSSGFLYLWEVDDAAELGSVTLPGDTAGSSGLVALTQYQVASRLSYLLWGTMPDDALSRAADAGELATPEQVGAQAARLLQNSERLGATLTDFHLQWLDLDNLDDLQKDPTTYPAFNDEVRQGFEAELGAFISDVMVAGDGTVRSLLTAKHTIYTSDGVAGIYGVQPAPDASNRLALNPEERSGLFTLAGFLASTGNTTGSNPPRRGKLIWTELLCGFVPPPPANVPAVEPPTESKTTRERFEAHTGNPCAGACHTLFDPYGFAFESYDGVGAYRSEENGFPIDASGTLKTPAGATLEFDNAVEMFEALSTAYEVDRCVADKWFRYMLNREASPADQASFEAAYRSAGAGAASDFSVRQFVANAVASTAFRMRSVE